MISTVCQLICFVLLWIILHWGLLSSLFHLVLPSRTRFPFWGLGDTASRSSPQRIHITMFSWHRHLRSSTGVACSHEATQTVHTVLPLLRLRRTRQRHLLLSIQQGWDTILTPVLPPSYITWSKRWRCEESVSVKYHTLNVFSSIPSPSVISTSRGTTGSNRPRHLPTPTPRNWNFNNPRPWTAALLHVK